MIREGERCVQQRATTTLRHRAAIALLGMCVPVCVRCCSPNPLDHLSTRDSLDTNSKRNDCQILGRDTCVCVHALVLGFTMDGGSSITSIALPIRGIDDLAIEAISNSSIDITTIIIMIKGTRRSRTRARSESSTSPNHRPPIESSSSSRLLASSLMEHIDDDPHAM